MANVSTFHESTWAFFIETNSGEGPGFTVSVPEGTAAAWAAAEGTTAFRHRHFEADPAWIRGVNQDDPALLDSLRAKNVPIRGIQTAEGGSAVLGLTGAEVATADGVQVTQTALMRFMAHAVGGIHRGNTTAVDVTVVSDVSYDVTSATNLEVGALVAIEDAGATGKLYAQRIETLSGTSLTFDEAPNFTVVAADVVHAVATIYPDADALQCGAVGYSTLSLYYQKGTAIYSAAGCKAQFDGISAARGEQPKLNFSLWAARTFPMSTSNSLSEPVWAGSIEGVPGIPIGIDINLRISQKGTSAFVCIDVETIEFEAGVPVVPLDTATACASPMEGRAGYTTEPGDTTMTLGVFLDGDWQDDFDNTQAMEVTVELLGAAGKFWCIKLPTCYLMPGPEYGQSQASNMQTLTFIAHESPPIAGAPTPNMVKANWLIGMG